MTADILTVFGVSLASAVNMMHITSGPVTAQMSTDLSGWWRGRGCTHGASFIWDGHGDTSLDIRLGLNTAPWTAMRLTIIIPLGLVVGV